MSEESDSDGQESTKETHKMEYGDDNLLQHEMYILRGKLARLNRSNLHSYFSGLRVIIHTLDTEREKCLESVYHLQELLPLKLRQLRVIRNELKELKVHIKNCLHEYITARESVMTIISKNSPELLKKFDRLSKMQENLQHEKFLRSIMDLSHTVLVALNNYDYEVVCERLLAFQRLPECSYIDAYDRVNYEERFSSLTNEVRNSATIEVQNFFKKINYPLERTVDIKSIQSLIEKVLYPLRCLDLTTHYSNPSASSNVVDLFLQPIKIRFLYHFYGKQKTNNDGKPEWYFTQILNWISANSELLEKIFYSVFFEEEKAISMIDEFERKVVELVTEKVLDVLPKIFFNAELFSHLIDETVSFETELQECEWKSVTGLVIAILCKEPYLSEWLRLERESCTVSVEYLLNQNDRWKNRYRQISDLDHLRVPECTDRFILLTESITQRYRLISDVTVRLKFLELQIVILDEFRLRLVQISQQLESPWETPFMQLLNSFWYIAYVLDEWNDSETFVRLQLNKNGRGVFDNIAEMYRHVWKQRVADMALAYYQHTKIHLNQYLKLRWFAVEPGICSEVTASFCPFVLEVRRLLSLTCSSVSPDSASTLFQILNKQIAKILNEMISGTSFNCHGAAQMLYDITYALIPTLNSLYARSSLDTFEALDEQNMAENIAALRLLSLEPSVAVIVYNNVYRSPEEMTPFILKPHNASEISRSKAVELFKQRCDINTSSYVAVLF